MNKLFISDLHLEQDRPDITQVFLKFLQNVAPKAAALYILGDFFEVWIGDDDETEFNESIINALRAATDNGLPIYFMHGNRDFLISKKFLRKSGCVLLAEEYTLDLFGTPALLMHGDTLCTQDIKYLKFRKKARNWVLQKLFLYKSLAKRRAIAEQYRAISHTHTSTACQAMMDVTQGEVERIMNTHKVQLLIHGHTHQQGTHHFIINERPAKRIVLGAWHTQGNALICKPNGEQEFIEIF